MQRYSSLTEVSRDCILNETSFQGIRGLQIVGGRSRRTSLILVVTIPSSEGAPEYLHQVKELEESLQQRVDTAGIHVCLSVCLCVCMKLLYWCLLSPQNFSTSAG